MDDWKTMNELRALPEDWESSTYNELLKARRSMMTDVIRRGFETFFGRRRLDGSSHAAN